MQCLAIKGYFTHETESPSPCSLTSTLIGGKVGAAPSSLHTTLEGPKEYISECKMDVKVYMDSYMVSNGSCFMVTWIIFKNHLLEVGLT